MQISEALLQCHALTNLRVILDDGMNFDSEMNQIERHKSPISLRGPFVWAQKKACDAILSLINSLSFEDLSLRFDA